MSERCGTCAHFIEHKLEPYMDGLCKNQYKPEVEMYDEMTVWKKGDWCHEWEDKELTIVSPTLSAVRVR